MGGVRSHFPAPEVDAEGLVPYARIPFLICKNKEIVFSLGNSNFQSILLQNPDAWALMGHVKYLTNDTAEARDCYERTISFVADASEMHSIYLRLASIYLQEGRVS